MGWIGEVFLMSHPKPSPTTQTRAVRVRPRPLASCGRCHRGGADREVVAQPMVTVLLWNLQQSLDICRGFVVYWMAEVPVRERIRVGASKKEIPLV